MPSATTASRTPRRSGDGRAADPVGRQPRSTGGRPRGRPGCPVLRSDPPSTLVQEPFPGDWPRIRWVRARHGSAVSVDRDAGDPWRDPDRPRARSRPPPHSGISPPRIRVRCRPRLVPILGVQPRRRRACYGFYERDFFHDYTPGLPVCPVARRHRRERAGRHRRPDQDPADPRRPRDRATSSGR